KHPARKAQQGMALILMVTMVVMGFAWFAVGALSKAAYGTADRETRTGRALKRAKEALLAYVAETAASSTELYPGRLPCPEVRSVAGNTSVVAGTGNAAYGQSVRHRRCGVLGPIQHHDYSAGCGADRLRQPGHRPI